MEMQTENSSEKTGSSEVESIGDQSAPTTDIVAQFDDVLGKNLDRLLGDRQGIETLPMNIFTVSCLILLATRETEIEQFPYLPPKRYSNESLLNDMADMNIEHGGDLEGYISSMLDKGYIRVENDGRMFPGEPVMKMAVLFDKVFPKMPGLNLVAYLGQMIDEVLSNRKPLDTALNQFDQMLSLQGVPLKRNGDSNHSNAAKVFPHLRVSAEPVQPVKRKIVAPDIKPSDIYSKLQTKAWTAPKPRTETFSASSDHEQVSPEKETQADLQVPTVSEAEITTDAGERSMEMDAPAAQETSETQMNFSPNQHDDSGLQDAHITPTEEPAPLRGYDQDFETESEDDDIEKKIAAFEEELSMKCPLCRTGKIVPSKTARGKAYYKCSNEECNFISWGKPYYLACPTCKNPFLIETPDSQGNMILKCPRTTCPHWQKFPWDQDKEHDIKSIAQETPAETTKKPRRVVRRRKKVVVRRKS